MQQRVEEREQPDQPPHLDQRVPPGESPQRGDRQRDEENDQGGAPGEVLHAPHRLGAQPIGSTPQQFDAKIRDDYEKWGPIIKAAGMKAE